MKNGLNQLKDIKTPFNSFRFADHALKHVAIKMAEKKTLNITYEDFLSILKEWDEYTSVAIRIMPKGYRTVYFDDGMADYPEEWAGAISCNFSDLAALIWESLKFGKDKLAAKHSEIYAEQQAEFFKEHGSIDPMSIFAKLGKSAQLKIIEEGLLKEAISIYEESQERWRQQQWLRDSQESEKRERQRAFREARKEPIKIEKQVCEIDKNQCVFCGRDYKYHSFRYLSLEEDKYESSNVILSCKACLWKRQKQPIEPKFGRFLDNQKEQL